MSKKVLTPAAWLILGLALGAAGTGILISRLAQASKPGPADIGYSQDMAVHHAQAVLMASMVRGRASPRIDALASQIESVQLGQIGVLNGWLALWGVPTLSSTPMRWMVPICGEGTQSGLATQIELAELQIATGPALDQIFLRLMLRHHRGGTSMDLAAIKGARLAPVRALARNVLSDEMGEIALMNEFLRQVVAQNPAPARGSRDPAAPVPVSHARSDALRAVSGFSRGGDRNHKLEGSPGTFQKRQSSLPVFASKATTEPRTPGSEPLYPMKTFPLPTRGAPVIPV